ncbi:baseplate assembly protein [Pseudoalteromonas luteoviolacea]|uniref:Baseplate assembly protein n=1 Tax=Pseudoalteromonas luteoviolacea NCIMB 1942 TaxID=1365253 RepID=A0A166Z6S3_9GAMM|nr:baseplate J/gp47 family protein [Pseudoalteromonas luteoviolacea]KZN43997.1 baseplate assembly protein [Pseudoalteromonas luteoviolacea NCIMB 1942]
MANLIDLSKVPVPDIIETLSFEQLYEKNKQMLIDIEPSYANALQFDSDPQAKQLQMLTYREMHLIAKINQATRANILASAFGKDLEALAANYNIERLVIPPENPATNPVTPAVLESDTALKRRVQLAFDGLNTAGSVDGYIFHTLGANGQVLDADAYSPAPCEIVIVVLAHTETGLPTDDLIIKIRNYFGLTDDGTAQLKTPSKVRPQGDRVAVQSAEIIHYAVEAVLNIMPGPDKQVVLAAAKQALTNYQLEQRKLGASITLSGVYKALHQSGVSDVNIIQPATSVNIEAYQAAYCTSVNIRAGA